MTANQGTELQPRAARAASTLHGGTCRLHLAPGGASSACYYSAPRPSEPVTLRRVMTRHMRAVAVVTRSLAASSLGAIGVRQRAAGAPMFGHRLAAPGGEAQPPRSSPAPRAELATACRVGTHERSRVEVGGGGSIVVDQQYRQARPSA